jgi:hypothetical protein
MCLPSLKGRHNKQVQAHQVHSSVLIKSYYWTGIFINILDDLLKDSLLFIRLIMSGYENFPMLAEANNQFSMA